MWVGTQWVGTQRLWAGGGARVAGRGGAVRGAVLAAILFTAAGAETAGRGALLLFATNAIAILIMGAAVFLLTGVAPLSRATANQHRVRTALAAVGGAAAIISGSRTLGSMVPAYGRVCPDARHIDGTME